MPDDDAPSEFEWIEESHQAEPRYLIILSGKKMRDARLAVKDVGVYLYIYIDIDLLSVAVQIIHVELDRSFSCWL